MKTFNLEPIFWVKGTNADNDFFKVVRKLIEKTGCKVILWGNSIH